MLRRSENENMLRFLSSSEEQNILTDHPQTMATKFKGIG